MKIIQIVTQMEFGGAQRIAYSLTEELRRRGHDALLWFLYTKRASYETQPWMTSLLPHTPSLSDYFRIMARLYQMLSTEKPDAVISHTHYSNPLAQAIAVLNGAHQRIAVQHSPPHTYPLVARLADLIGGTIGLYTCNVAVSNAVANELARYPRHYAKYISMINNGIANIVPCHARGATRAKWNIPVEVPLMVNVGRLSREKNQAFLIRLLPKATTFHLALIGEGALRGELERLARLLRLSDRVHFIGEIPPMDVASLLNSGDVFVFPSSHEAVGLALLEAMSAGIPIIASDIPSSRDILGQNGVLLNLAHPSTWIRALQAISSLEAPSPSVIKAAMQRARAFTVTQMADKYEKILLSGGTGRSLTHFELSGRK